MLIKNYLEKISYNKQKQKIKVKVYIIYFEKIAKQINI